MKVTGYIIEARAFVCGKETSWKEKVFLDPLRGPRLLTKDAEDLYNYMKRQFMKYPGLKMSMHATFEEIGQKKGLIYLKHSKPDSKNAGPV